ncbi:uncharacterized protein LOC128667439 [Microplitis demolitor]|uniref:uncharacterized protein LOC128667439 n=1 Tax=Microplitis demolitor TaxID=69319 RepID=UPI00235B6526|nr:uncharacterized protein LOC128667439 [Microplitis demolitor]XP_053593341.1 uncharacterized protein LOC128667439 [Microplitis demolitor]
MTEDKKLSRFYLVLFSKTKEDGKVEEIDIVPANWIFFGKNNSCRCKFMPGPFDQSNYSKLQAMVKNCAKPSSKWPDYNVEIRGRANSYEEAEERLKILNKELYAFTTENEDSAKLQASKDLKLLKMKSNKKNIDNLQKELNTFEVEFDDTEPSGRKNSSLQLNDKRKGKKMMDHLTWIVMIIMTFFDNQPRIYHTKLVTLHLQPVDQNC